MIDFENIQEMIFMSDDAVGAVVKSVLVKFVEGSALEFEGYKAIDKLIVELKRQAPWLAERIERELVTGENPNNYELLLFDRGA